MRLIFIAFKLNFEAGGGACYELDTKIKSLLKFGHTVKVVTLFSSQNKIPFGLPYHVIEEQTKSFRFFSIQKNVYDLLLKYQNETDVFLVDGQFGYGSGWYRFCQGRVPVIAHFNRELSSFPDSTRKNLLASPFSLKKKLRFIFERLVCFPILNYNNLFTFTSPFLQELYIKYGVDRKKTMVMPDFFDSRAILDKIDQAAILRQRVEQKQRLVILCGGRMVPEKGLDVVIKALANLNHPDHFKLIITGTGPEEENLKKMAQELKVEPLVSFTGWLPKEDVYQLFKQADIYVVPRWRPELTSMIVLEAMAFMLPYIVTKNTALSWQAEDSALMFDDENYQELARQIEHLENNPDLRVKLVSRGLQRLSELDCKTIAPKLNDALSCLKRE